MGASALASALLMQSSVFESPAGGAHSLAWIIPFCTPFEHFA